MASPHCFWIVPSYELTPVRSTLLSAGREGPRPALSSVWLLLWLGRHGKARLPPDGVPANYPALNGVSFHLNVLDLAQKTIWKMAWFLEVDKLVLFSFFFFFFFSKPDCRLRAGEVFVITVVSHSPAPRLRTGHSAVAFDDSHEPFGT